MSIENQLRVSLKERPTQNGGFRKVSKELRGSLKERSGKKVGGPILKETKGKPQFWGGLPFLRLKKARGVEFG